MSRLNRRRFLCVAGAASGCATIGLAARMLDHRRTAGDFGRSNSDNTEPVALTRTSWALGSNVSITAIHCDRETAKQAIDAAFDELELVEQLMSIYRSQSQLSRLNRDGVVDDPHPYFVEILRASRRMSRQSGGAFDVTVQPLWSLHDTAKNKGRLPTSSELDAARARINWRNIDVHEGRIALRGEGTSITLNGVAQGYAADRALAVLRNHGVRHALVDTGEIGARGEKAGGGAWTVGIQHPRREDAFVALANLDGRCLATSGDYATTFSEDKTHHHLFDPRTGRSPTELASVSVVAPTGAQADALSTAVLVLGPESGFKLIRATSRADALFVLKTGQTLVTDGFPLDT